MAGRIVEELWQKGKLHEEGKSVPKSDAKAVEYYDQYIVAMGSGDISPRKQQRLANIYLRTEQYSKAANFFEKVVLTNSLPFCASLAREKLGDLYAENHPGFKQDNEKSIRWYCDRIAQCLVEKEYTRLLLFVKDLANKHSTKNPDILIRCLTYLEEQGRDIPKQYYWEAIYVLGEAYYKKNKKKEAFIRFKQAADGEYIFAQHRVAKMLQEGDGIPKDEALAVQMYEKRAKSSPNGSHAYLISYCYGRGRCGYPLNIEKSVIWMFIAVKKYAQEGRVNSSICELNSQLKQYEARSSFDTLGDSVVKIVINGLAPLMMQPLPYEEMPCTLDEKIEVLIDRVSGVASLSLGNRAIVKKMLLEAHSKVIGNPRLFCGYLGEDQNNDIRSFDDQDKILALPLFDEIASTIKTLRAPPSIVKAIRQSSIWRTAPSGLGEMIASFAYESKTMISAETKARKLKDIMRVLEGNLQQSKVISSLLSEKARQNILASIVSTKESKDLDEGSDEDVLNLAKGFFASVRENKALPLQEVKMEIKVYETLPLVKACDSALADLEKLLHAPAPRP